MVGDYATVSFAGTPRMAHPVFAVATPPTGSTFHENAASAGIDVARLTSAGTVKAKRDAVRVKPGRHHRGQLVPRGFPKAN